MVFETRISGEIAYAARGGAGEPWVLLHGIGSRAQSFAPLTAALPSGAQLFAWNAPGYAGSEPLAVSWPQAADYADALLRWLDRIGVKRARLLGHSLGTLIAASAAAAAPERFSRLTLVAPALGHGASAGGPLGPAATARLADLDRLGAAQFAAARAPRLVWRPADNPAVLAQVERDMAAIERPGYDAAVRMLGSGRLLDDAARLRTPTDVIVGAEDVVTPPEAARAAHQALPVAVKGRYVEIPDAGHAVHQQAPRALAAALTGARAPAPQGASA